ncbi:MAG: DUF4292 domain-containing protein [Chitinophagaceae bacterium]|nr:MAG: DUF4292 domain-containing protein [Chitinophagaceae bacterium]
MRLILIILLGATPFLWSCKTTKAINKVIAPKDSVVVVAGDVATKDSLALVEKTNADLARNYIDFKTFSAKIKVDVEDANGKQPDITATLRMVKDSAIWLSLTATFLNIEVYRVYITKDSVILMNKQDKEVQYRSLDYLQEVTQIPFDFTTLQNILIGNPVFFDSSNAAIRKLEAVILVSSVGSDFKNLLTLSGDKGLLMHSKLDDVDMLRNRTASITYDDYAGADNRNFSTKRQITISEKNKIDIKLNFKQFEFNKELSVGFSVPNNYKKK